MAIGALDSGLTKLLYDAKKAIQSMVNGDSSAIFSDVAFDGKGAGKALGFDVSAVDPKTLAVLHNRGTLDTAAGRVTMADGPLGIGGDSTTLAKANAEPDNSAAAVAARQAADFKASLRNASSGRDLTKAELDASNAENLLPQGLVNVPAAPYDGHSVYDTGSKPGIVNHPQGVFRNGYWR